VRSAFTVKGDATGKRGGLYLGRLASLAQNLQDELSADEPVLARRVNGRLVGLLASKYAGTAEHLAVGLSALPPTLATPWHSHTAEELAIVLSGSGQIEIEADRFDVAEGDIVLTPSDVEHRTSAGGSPLVVLWVYAPAGSELRWLADQPEERP
jgi:quercetin dioxygenase-like cupin family protein